MENYLYQEECSKIIKACFEVQNNLGHGFLEAVYQEALMHEFNLSEIPFEKEKRLDVYYKQIKLNKYYIADFICNDKIILEIKALDAIHDDHISQVLNYLKATNFKLGLIINFGTPKVQIKRVIR
ncbi:MAG TPA: GxxExxY protein [Prolixibacteraceae bacterium]|nr:GxxExxY protein [Prolixibacteraceae bacterium]